MYPQHTDFSQPTSNPPKTTPNSQSTSTNNSRNSSSQSSLPCGQRTPAASTTSSDAPSSQTPPQTFTTSHQPQLPTNTQHTSPSPHKQHMKTPLKRNIDQSSQSSIAGEDQQHVPKSADGTRVKCSKQQPRQPDECLCFHCNLPGHFKRNCPKIPYCSKCRTKGHTQDRCTNKSQRTRHTHQTGEPRDQQKRKDNLPQFSSHHNKCLRCAGDHQTANCDEYGEAFSKNNEDIGRTKLVKMDIDTGDSPPVSSRPYTLPLKHYEWVQREIESLEWAGVITKSMSKWASPIVIVPKNSAPGEPPKRRLCVDFRKVNELQQEVITAGKTKGQISIHPLPKIDEMYAKLKGTKVFSTIDLRSGYHHIALGKSPRAKTTVVTPFGKYEFLMVPFGLAQAPAYFQLLMNKVLKGLREAGLKMKHSKCDFFKSEIHYLGHLISPEGISPLPNKLDSIKHMPVPNSAKEIKQFLGLTGYYRKFVPRFEDISRPLTTLTKKDAKFEWTSACQKSFELLKEALCGEPVLKYADTSKPCTLYTDASKYG